MSHTLSYYTRKKLSRFYLIQQSANTHKIKLKRRHAKGYDKRFSRINVPHAFPNGIIVNTYIVFIHLTSHVALLQNKDAESSRVEIRSLEPTRLIKYYSRARSMHEWSHAGPPTRAQRREARIRKICTASRRSRASAPIVRIS